MILTTLVKRGALAICFNAKTGEQRQNTGTMHGRTVRTLTFTQLQQTELVTRSGATTITERFGASHSYLCCSMDNEQISLIIHVMLSYMVPLSLQKCRGP